MNFASIMKRTLPALLTSACAALGMQAQQQQPYYSYRNGLGFTTPDSAYSLNIRFRMQHRALMNTADDEDFSPGSFEARVRRCRLVFTGHTVSPRLTYYLQLSFSRGDMDWSVTETTTQNVSPNVVRDAVIYYRAAKSWVIGIGQTKLPGNRQRVNSSGALQFYDRSIVNAAFTTDRDFGFFSNYTVKSGEAFTTVFKAAVTSGEGRNSNISNPGLAYTGRVELLPLGAFTDGGDYFEGDVAREPKPKLSIAGGYMLNDLAVRSGGQLGRDLYGQKTFHLYMADVMFKYKGFCVASEYMRRDADNPYVTGTDGKSRFIATGEGINNQVSYCFPSRWEIAARQALITPHRDVLKDFTQAEQYVIGVTKYLNMHKVKAQFNIVYNRERNLAKQSDMNKYFSAVFQVELGL
jgi:phosphate-selective porin OprO and OprP